MSDQLRRKLESEIDELPWEELTRSFAFGRLFVVRGSLDLVEAALAMAQNEAATVEAWIQQERFGRPEDDEVAVWEQEKIRFQVLIVSPFVVVKAMPLH